MSTQNEPIDSGSASDIDKIAGILEQTREDLNQGNGGNAAEVLTQRFADSGIEVSPGELENLVKQLEA